VGESAVSLTNMYIGLRMQEIDDIVNNLVIEGKYIDEEQARTEVNRILKERDVKRGYLLDLEIFKLDHTQKNITFKGIDRETLINLIRVFSGYDQKVLMSIDNNAFYTLSDKNVKRLVGIIGSDEISGDWTNSDTIVYNSSKLVREVTVKFSKIIGREDYIEGSKFNHICLLPIDLKRYQIAKNEDELFEYEFSFNCFVYSLLCAGVDKKICDDIQLTIKNDYLPAKFIKNICITHDLHVTVKRPRCKDLLRYGNTEKKCIEIGLIDSHYFYIERTSITKQELINMCDGSVYHDSSKVITSFNMIQYMIENKEKYLRPINHITKKEFNNVYDTLKNADNLNYLSNNIKSNEYKQKKTDDYVNVFFDFETTTEGINESYLCKIDVDDEKDSQQLTKIDFVGKNAGLKMLRYVSQKYKKFRLIAHNISYDFKFIYEYLDRLRLIERGKRLLHGNAIFKCGGGYNTNVQLQDSYALISMKLKNFSEAFGLKVEKEYMPYKMYTKDNLEKKFIPLDAFKKYENYNEFYVNCVKWGCLEGNDVDLIKYSSKYCEMDCKVLKDGYNAFRNSINKICDLDINNYVSIASIANAYYEKKGVYDGVNKLSGIVREFIQNCVVGGRTMTRNNKQHHKIVNLDDFDAVNLYPSAMKRLGGFLLGTPKVLEDLSYDFLSKQDGYFVEIRINHVNKSYAFPLMSEIDKKGVRNFTNDMEGKTMFVDKITLEDLIMFHHITFDVLRGYYYNEGRNYKLGEVIEYLFKERAKEKKNKNPIEGVYKLLMNSAYGKSLLKPIETENKYLPIEEAENYVSKHFNHIQSFTKLADDKTIQVKEYVTVDEHFNNVSCGVEVLAMSKRIMNEVMCLAEDMGIMIYYQDTDSMHIECDKVKLLADTYKLKYGRELIGDYMGQFHSDFKIGDLKCHVYSSESYFLGKKCYIDHLHGSGKYTYESDYHIRMKGVSNEAILLKGNPMETYKRLYEGDSITFDLTCAGDHPCFEHTKDYEIITRMQFDRAIKFNINR
jgi:hypothetical protein